MTKEDLKDIIDKIMITSGSIGSRHLTISDQLDIIDDGLITFDNFIDLLFEELTQNND